MNPMIETFGALVGKAAAKSPDRARRLLEAAFYASNFQAKHFPSRKLTKDRAFISPVCMDAVLHPLAHPERSAIVNLFLPCEILHAMRIEPQIAEGLSCYFSGAGSEQYFIEYARQKGVPDTLCSYHKILTGIALSGVLPKPRLIANTTLACDANTNTFRRIAAHYGVPHFTVDTPCADDADAVQYVADQLRELARFTEEAMHERFSEDALRAVLACEQRSMQACRSYYDLLADRYLPNEMTSEMYTLFATHILLGKPEIEQYFEQLCEDAKNAPVFQGGNRILWVHSLPYWQNSLRTILNFSEENQLLCSDMSFDALFEPDPEHPYESMARRLLGNTFNGPMSRRADKIAEMALKLHANGVVFFCHWGCKNTIGGAGLVRDRLEQEGIPMLTLDGDGCDRRNINDGQMRTRLEAFLELLEERRRAR